MVIYIFTIDLETILLFIIKKFIFYVLLHTYNYFYIIFLKIYFLTYLTIFYNNIGITLFLLYLFLNKYNAI